MEVGERPAFTGQSIEIGGANRFGAKRTNISISKVVAVNEDHGGALGAKNERC